MTIAGSVLHGSNINNLEYLLTAVFSAVASVFSYLARRSGKRNTASIEDHVKPSLETLESRTNGELLDKIRQAVREEVGHDELVQAVSEEAVRNYLTGLLAAHLMDDDTGKSLFDDLATITERRKRPAEEEAYPNDGK